MSPASRVCSARSRLTTTITADVSIHAGQHCLPHAAAAEAGWCCREPTLTVPRHEIAAENHVADRPTITGRTDRPTWVCTLRRHCGDADEPSQGTPVSRIASDGDHAVHGHPR